MLNNSELVMCGTIYIYIYIYIVCAVYHFVRNKIIGKINHMKN